MIAVMARVRVASWDQFRQAHDAPSRVARRKSRGNLTHRVLNQLDDPTDVVFLDTWSSPQDSDSYYHSDDFQSDLVAMGGTLMEIIKLEETDATAITDD
jgi:quinol monooxygenase YgiN